MFSQSTEQHHTSLPPEHDPLDIMSDLIKQSSTIKDRFEKGADTLLHTADFHAIGMFTTSIALGLLARDSAWFEPSTINNIQEIIQHHLAHAVNIPQAANMTGQDLMHISEEAASYVLFESAVGLFVGGKFFEAVVHRETRKKGIAALPRSWKNHLLVVDPDRLIFDEIASLRPHQSMALVHDGRILHEDSLEGGNMDSRHRRHLNSLNKDLLSDKDFLKKTRPQKAGGWVFNLWQPNNALYSALSENGNKTSIPPAKVNNVMMTLSRYWDGQAVSLIIPKGMQSELGEVDEIWDSHANFVEYPRFNIHKIHPEDVISCAIAERTKKEDGTRYSVSVVHDGDERLNNRIEKQFAIDLEDAGCKMAPTEDADVLVVYLENDDLTIERCQNLRMSHSGRIIALLDQTRNIEQAKIIPGLVAWSVPSIVANSLDIPLKRKNTSLNK